MTENIALGILVLGEAAHFFSAFNPSIFTIRRFPDQQTERDIFTGCLFASIFGLIISVATSIIAKSKIPLLFGLAGIFAMDLIYYYTVKTALTKGV